MHKVYHKQNIHSLFYRYNQKYDTVFITCSIYYVTELFTRGIEYFLYFCVMKIFQIFKMHEVYHKRYIHQLFYKTIYSGHQVFFVLFLCDENLENLQEVYHKQNILLSFYRYNERYVCLTIYIYHHAYSNYYIEIYSINKY